MVKTPPAAFNPCIIFVDRGSCGPLGPYLRSGKAAQQLQLDRLAEGTVRCAAFEARL